MAAVTPISGHDTRYSYRTALYDKSHTRTDTGASIIRRLPWNLVKYKDFPEFIEPVDTIVSATNTSGLVADDKPVDQIAFVDELGFYRGTDGMANAGPVSPPARA